MKRKIFQETKNKLTTELQKDLVGHREHLRILKFDLAAGKVKNIKEMQEIKKTIAQILTILNNKENRK